VEAKPREETEVAPPPEPTPAPKKKIGRKGVKKKPAPTAKEAVAKKWEAAEKKAAKEIVGEKWKAAEKKAAKEIVGKKWRAAEAKATEEAESAKPRFYVEESTDGYQVIRRDNNQVEGTYDTEEEAQRVADDTNARYEREAKVIKEKLEPEKPKAKTKSERVVGKGAAGGAMAAIGGDAFAAAEPEPTTLLPEPVEDEQEAPEPPPAVKTLAQKMTQQGMVDGLLEILAPAARSEQALFSSNLKRQALARAAQRDQAAIYKLEQYGKLFRFKSMAEIVEFIDLLETGQKQTDTALQEAADVFRAVLDRTTKRLQEHGVLLQNYEHYFPHLFKRPDAARDVIRKLLGARQLKPATFLKHRKYLTVKEALDAGLELAHHNPVKMIVARLAEEHKYLAGLEIMEGLGVRGMRRFVASNLTKSYQPAGYEIIQDPAFRVVAPPEFTVEEAYDKLLADQLMSIASAMGVSHKRVATMRGQRWGESGPGKSIKTRFAGPISVLAHEIGHQIGNQYGLYEYMLRGPHAEGKVIEKGPHKGKKSKSDAQKKRGAIAKEWRALADLRHEGMEVTEARQDYERMKAEKEAVILEAWLAAPEKMESVAPTITQAWKEFLAAQPVLEPLLHLDRSVVLGRGGITRTLPGVLELGHWAVPKEVATIINSYLKPGLRGHRNKLVAGTYGGVRYISNAMIQASLGLTMFHSLNVTTDAMASSVGLGLQQLGRGQVGKALWNVVRSPFAGIAEVVRGHRLIKAMRMDMREIADPKLKAMVETIIAAGGRAELDAMYHNHAAEGLETSIRTLITGEGSRLLSLAKLPGQTLLAAIEVLAKPTMQWHVPRLKLGVFYRFAQDVYSEANRRGWDDDRIQTELARAWDSVDNRMGQLVYDNLGWARWLRDTSMAAVRSVGWNLGSWREYGGALADVPLTVSRVKGGGDLVSRRIGYAVGALTTYAMLGVIFAYLWRGRWPWDDDDYEEKDLFFPKTGKTNPDGTPERLSFPTYAKDIVAYTTRPGKTIEHKLNPIWNLIADLWENENYYGTEIRNRDDPIVQQIEDVALRNWMRMTAAGDDPWVSAATALSGIGSAPRYITETPAQALMSKITQAKIAQGARTQEAAEWSQKRKRLVREVRSGKKADLSGLTSLQIRDIRREAKMTSFQARFDNLSFYDALDVFNVCTAEERTAVFPQLVRKKGTAKKVTDDMLEMYYALRVGQGQVDVRRKADLAQAGKTLMSISTGQRSGEADDVYELRLQEAIASLKANPEFELDRRAVSALMRASVTPKKGKKRRFKTTRMYYGTGKKRGRYTAFGKRVARVWQALGI
jgi:hypothetical protein